jgi:pilus assembly protein CpaF
MSSISSSSKLVDASSSATALFVELFDETTTDAVFSGCSTAMVRSGVEWIPVPSPFATSEFLADWMIDTFEEAGVALNFMRPMGSVVIDGFRLHGVLPHGVSARVQLTVRRLRAEALESRFFESRASIHKFERLAQAMLSGKSVLIAGGAGTGKTTLLRNLLRQLRDFRVLTIEDAPELALDGPNVVALTTRDANQEGLGAISMTDLLVQALRMSPDRIAVGEVRGIELAVMLEALNTGQAGGGATIHANSWVDLPARLEAIGLRAGLNPDLLARQVVAAFDFAAFVERSPAFEIAAIAQPVIGHRGLEFVRVD